MLIVYYLICCMSGLGIPFLSLFVLFVKQVLIYVDEELELYADAQITLSCEA